MRSRAERFPCSQNRYLQRPGYTSKDLLHSRHNVGPPVCTRCRYTSRTYRAVRSLHHVNMMWPRTSGCVILSSVHGVEESAGIACLRRYYAKDPRPLEMRYITQIVTVPTAVVLHPRGSSHAMSVKSGCSACRPWIACMSTNLCNARVRRRVLHVSQQTVRCCTLEEM